MPLCGVESSLQNISLTRGFPQQLALDPGAIRQNDLLVMLEIHAIPSPYYSSLGLR